VNLVCSLITIRYWNVARFRSSNVSVLVSSGRRNPTSWSSLWEIWQGLGLGLVSDWKSKVSVSCLSVSFTSLLIRLYCNSITGLLLNRLQSVWNAAARLVRSAWRYDNIMWSTQDMRTILGGYCNSAGRSCLPVSARNRAVVMGKLAVPFLSDEWRIASPSLNGVDDEMVVPHTAYLAISDGAFPVAAVQILNALPISVPSHRRR